MNTWKWEKGTVSYHFGLKTNENFIETTNLLNIENIIWSTFFAQKKYTCVWLNPFFHMRNDKMTNDTSMLCGIFSPPVTNNKNWKKYAVRTRNAYELRHPLLYTVGWQIAQSTEFYGSNNIFGGFWTQILPFKHWKKKFGLNFKMAKFFCLAKYVTKFSDTRNLQVTGEKWKNGKSLKHINRMIFALHPMKL